MPGPIKGNAPPAQPYEKLSKTLEQLAEGLKQSAQTLEKSGILRGADAFAEASHAGAAALLETGKLAEGVAEALTAGVAGWHAEGVEAGARYVAKNTARALAGLATTLPRVLGEGRLTTVRQLTADPDGVAFSEKLFGRSAKALQRSADALQVSWASWGQALGRLAEVNLPLAAGHASGVAENLAKAAALTTSAATVKLAELGVKVASRAVAAAQAGSPNARALTELASRLLAATAAVLPLPDPAAQVNGQLAGFQAELARLTN